MLHHEQARTSIVIVLKHNALRSSCHRWLAELYPGTDIFEAANGADGIANSVRHPSSIVLMKNELPDMSGYEAMQIMKNKKSSARVILLSVMGETSLFRIPPGIEPEACLDGNDLFSKLPGIISNLISLEEKGGAA